LARIVSVRQASLQCAEACIRFIRGAHRKPNVGPCSMARTSVLLVDDDCELDQMLTEYLSAEAFSVVTALDGSAALKLVANESFDWSFSM
jgi:PleD family two-component response regulator